MRWYGSLSLAALALAPVKAIFSDDAFNLDYHHALLGIPQRHTTFFHKPEASSNAALLYTLSDVGVLGAINPRDGTMVWRQAIAGQPFEEESKSYLIAGEDDGKITTAHGKQVASWDASHGRLLWTFSIRGKSKAIDLQAVPVLGSSTDGAVQDVVLLTEPQQEGRGYTVLRVGGDGSGERWHWGDFDTKLDAVVGIATSPKHVYYIARSSGLITGQKTRVITLDITTGKLLKDSSLSLDSELTSADGQLVSASGSRNPFLITCDKPYKSLKLNLLGTSKITTITLDDKREEIIAVGVHAPQSPHADPHFLVHVQTATRSWAEVYHINPDNGEATRAYSLPATQEISAYTASSNAAKVFFIRVTGTEVAVFSSESHGYLGRFTRAEIGAGRGSSSHPVMVTAEVASRDAGTVAVRAAVLSPEGSWYLIRNGDTQWSRPEMLAYAKLAAWDEDTVTDPLIQDLEAETSGDPASAYINRVYRHTTELMHLPGYLLQLVQKLLGSSSVTTPATHNLAGSRSVILATKPNRLFSISGTSGAVQWHADLSGVFESTAVIHSLSSRGGRLTLYSSDGSITVLNTTTGSLIESKAGTIEAAKIVELPGSPASTILKINEDGVPHFASDLAPSLPDEGNIVMTFDKAGGVAGWTVGTSITKIWTFAPKDGKVLDINARPLHDPIASIGRVLGNRSVLYKYFSPNLALLTLKSASSLTISLVDAVTGTVLHSSTHQGVLWSSPISAVLSENWFAYTFTSSDPETSAISSQLIISELFESSTPNDRGQSSSKTNYSSFGPDANTRPHVISAAFNLLEPISQLTVTQTTQGITSRQLLAYVPNSNAIAAIPRHVLDARRPAGRDPTSSEAEEGLFRYTPELPLDPKAFLSHSREVIGIKQISTVPTLLESTSAVFGFGHDIFGTQVAPSQTFDVLGKSFKKAQLLATVLALYLGVLGIRPLVRRKVVQRGWA